MTDIEHLIYLVILFFGIFLGFWAIAIIFDWMFGIKETMARRDSMRDKEAER